jgi:hypothetical protein
LPQRLEERRGLIWHREQVFGYALAKVLIPKPKVTVWMIMLPLLFLFFMQDLKKYKAGIRGFADGFLKNKKIALDLAFNALQEGASLDRVVADFAAESRSESGIHTDLFEKQLREIACLANHYQRLMQGSGRGYAALVQQAYGSAAKYHQFLDKLFGLEDAVLQTAFAIQPPEGDAQALARQMQIAARRMRREAADKLFQG